MWIYFLHLSTYLLFLIAPFLYKSKRLFNVGFYTNMIRRHSARRMYTLAVFLVLLSMHFYHLQVFRSTYDVIPSTLILMFLYSHSNCDRTLRFLQSQRLMFAAMVVTIALVVTPHMFMLGVTLAVMMFASIYYPSVICMRSTDGIGIHMSPYSNGIIGTYHQWDLMEGSTLKFEK